MVVPIVFGVLGLLIAAFVYYVYLWSERDQREVMEQGQPFVAYVLIAEDHIYRPSRQRSESFGAGSRLLIAFEPESPGLHADLRALTARLHELSQREPRTEAERKVATLVTDHSFRPGRIPIPPELTGGRVVYSYDGTVEREHLSAGHLELPYIHCKAVPGEKGNIYMIPYPNTEAASLGSPTE